MDLNQNDLNDYLLIETQVNKEIADAKENAQTSSNSSTDQQWLRPPLLNVPSNNTSHEFSRQIQETKIDEKPVITKGTIIVKHSKGLQNCIPESIQIYPNTATHSKTSSRQYKPNMYLENRHNVTKERVEKMRREKYNNDMKECTYKPKIVISKANQSISTSHYMKPIPRKCESSRKLDIACSFKPAINVKSQKIVAKLAQHLLALQNYKSS